MNYKDKYLIYKNKYLDIKNQLGGGPKDYITFRLKIMNHSDISRLGMKKIVATPHSTTGPIVELDMWDNLDEENRTRLIQLYRRINRWTLGVYVYKDEYGNRPVGCFMGNKIIFYVVEYLDLLAIASGITSEKLLKIFSVPTTNKFHLDLIKIAFGDLDLQLETDEGLMVFMKYKSLVTK